MLNKNAAEFRHKPRDETDELANYLEYFIYLTKLAS